MIPDKVLQSSSDSGALMIRGLRTVALAAAVFSTVLAVHVRAQAQSAAASAAAAADPEYQALFNRMFADPQNMEVTFEFAEVATRLGDYEAAIGALERVLYYNPDLAEVKVELARLYLHIGGNQVAQSYIEQAMATPGAAPETVAAARQLLTQGDSGAPSAFSFILYGGMRYQTNASAGPNRDLARTTAYGGPSLEPVDDMFARAADWNSFILGSAAYSHDFGNGVSVELGLFGYYTKQFDLSEFDVGLVEVQAGPRVAVPLPMVSDSSVKIYAIGTASTLAGSTYYRGAGVGVSSRFRIGEQLQLEPSYEYRDRDFKDSDLNWTSYEQTGKLQILALYGGGTLFGLPWLGRVASSWNEIDDPWYDFNSYHRISADLAIPISFSLNWGEAARHFVFTPTAGFTLTDYAQPNGDIDRDVTREDFEWRVGASLDMQIDANFGVRTSVQYANINSNLPNFDMDNLSVSIGPTFSY